MGHKSGSYERCQNRRITRLLHLEILSAPESAHSWISEWPELGGAQGYDHGVARNDGMLIEAEFEDALSSELEGNSGDVVRTTLGAELCELVGTNFGESLGKLGPIRCCVWYCSWR